MIRAWKNGLRATDTRHQYQMLVLMTAACLIGMVLLVSILFANIILKRNGEYVTRVIDQYRQSLSLEGVKTKEFVEAIVYNPTVVSFLSEKDPLSRYEYGQGVSTFLDYIRAGRKEVLDIFFLRRDDPPVTFYAISKAQGEIAQTLLGRSTPDIIGAYPYLSVVPSAREGEALALFAGCAIHDTAHASAQKVQVGAVAVALDIAAWTGNLSELMGLKGVSYLLMDAKGTPIAGALQCGQPALLTEAYAYAKEGRATQLSDRRYAITITQLADIPATLITCVDDWLLLSDLWQATLIIIIATLLLSLLLLFAYRWIGHEVTQPIAALTRFIGSIGQPNAPTRIRPEGNRDVRKLCETVNTMLDEQEQLTKDLIHSNTSLIASELATRKAELKYLRSQINPHFLYNTLEVIRAISIVRKVPEIGTASKSLARILRYSIQGGDVIPLRDELAITQDYLTIQKLRFRDRITISIEISEEALALPVPRLCLQPAVENAFVHGLESAIAKGMLRITGWVEGDLLRIVVADNGAGMEEARLARLNALLAAPEESMMMGRSELEKEGPIGSSGIGLVNVALRIRLMGTQAHGLSVTSTLGTGTTVELRLPILAKGTVSS